MPIFTYPKFQAPDINGVNLSGGKVYFYLTGTTTDKDTYSDEALTTINANPVILDSRGEADIYLSGEYKVVLKTAADVTIWTLDPYSGLILATTDINVQTASYTAVLEDSLRDVYMNVVSSNTFTIPPNSEVPFSNGVTLIVTWYGAGQTTIAEGAGVTVRTSSSLAIASQYDTVGVKKKTTNEWIITGAFS